MQAQMFTGRAHFRNAPLHLLIQIAYNRKSPPSGGPEWIRYACYDIDAQASDAEMQRLRSLPRPQQVHDTLLMLQGLLADRFKLVLHDETEQLPIYALVLARNGPKLQPAPGGGGIAELTAGWGKLQAQRARMSDLAEFLSERGEVGGRKVIDETGLNGWWDFTLQWQPVTVIDPGGYGSAAQAGSRPGNPEPFLQGLPLQAALHDELGLQLKGRTGPVDVLVVASAEKIVRN